MATTEIGNQALGSHSGSKLDFPLCSQKIPSEQLVSLWRLVLSVVFCLQGSVNNLRRDHFLRGNLRWLLSPIWFCTGPDAPPGITFG